MKKTFYLSLLWTTLIVAKTIPIYASFNSSSPNDSAEFYETTFRKKTHKKVNEKFEKDMREILVRRAEIGEKITRKDKSLEGIKKEIGELERKVRENNEILVAQAKLREYYKNKDCLDPIKELEKRRASQEKRLGAAKDSEVQEAIKQQLLKFEKEIKIFEISEDELKRQNELDEELIASLTSKKEDLAEESSEREDEKLEKDYNNLQTLKVETTYYLSEPFEEGKLFSSAQLVEVLKAMGVEDAILKRIDQNAFYELAVRSLELPVPYVDKKPADNTSLNPQRINKYMLDDDTKKKYEKKYKKRIDLWKNRRREQAQYFAYFASAEITSKIKGDPHEDYEKNLIAIFLQGDSENTESEKQKNPVRNTEAPKKGQEIFTQLLKSLRESTEENDYLEEIIKKAIPDDTLGLFPVICAGLNTFDIHSIPSGEIAVQVILSDAYKDGKSDDFFENLFFICRNRLIKCELTIRILEGILKRFQEHGQTPPTRANPVSRRIFFTPSRTMP